MEILSNSLWLSVFPRMRYLCSFQADWNHPGYVRSDDSAL